MNHGHDSRLTPTAHNSRWFIISLCPLLHQVPVPCACGRADVRVHPSLVLLVDPKYHRHTESIANRIDLNKSEWTTACVIRRGTPLPSHSTRATCFFFVAKGRQAAPSKADALERHAGLDRGCFREGECWSRTWQRVLGTSYVRLVYFYMASPENVDTRRSSYK